MIDIRLLGVPEGDLPRALSVAKSFARDCSDLKPGISNCVIYGLPDFPTLAAYKTKRGQIVVRGEESK